MAAEETSDCGSGAGARSRRARAAAPIYVEIAIRSTLDEVWRRTQTPELHERWDLRFTRIEYLPRATDAEPQRFLYATRIGFGLEVRGTGETVGGSADGRGARSSALRFGSGSALSLIREGSGYWKYEPQDDGSVRFLTRYDYDVRHGALGALVDRALFRPLLGWATAWSFDRLRRWCEDGTPPESARACALAHGVARAALGFAWLWHGLVPKLLARSSEELALLADAGVAPSWLTAIGAAEAALGLATLLLVRARWPLVATLVLMPLALAGVALSSPRVLAWPFGPVTTNVSLAALAASALALLPHAPSARTCLRAPPRVEGA